MAEITTPKPKGGGLSTLMIIVLFVVLIGGGAGLWYFLKPKKKDDKVPDTDKIKDDGGSKSRNNTSSQNVPLTAAQIKALLDRQNAIQGPTAGLAGSKTNPFYVNSTSAQDLISKIAFAMQGHQETMDLIRMKYDIGKALLDGRDIICINQFKSFIGKRPIVKLDGTLGLPDMNVAKYWLNYPIYGTSEPNGSDYRGELQNILNKDWRNINLTNKKDGTNSTWCPQLGLNFLIGSVGPYTPSTHDVWMSWWSPAERDFYKGINSHWVNDMQIADEFVDRNNITQVVPKSHSNAVAHYPAQIMYTIVQNWVEEIDRLDKVTKWEALRILMRPKAEGGEGYFFSFLDPNDLTKKFYSDYGVSEDPTVKDTAPLILDFKNAA